MIINQQNNDNTPIKFTNFQTSYGKDLRLEASPPGLITLPFLIGNVIRWLIIAAWYVFRIKPLQNTLMVGSLSMTEAVAHHVILETLTMMSATKTVIEIVNISMLALFCVHLTKIIISSIKEILDELKKDRA